VPDPTLQPLLELGLTRLETNIYCLLVTGESRSTQEIAESLQQPPDDVAVAVNTLRERGAVMVSAADPDLHQAIPAEEVLAHATQRFHRIRNRASGALRKLAKSPPTEDMCSIESAPEVWSRLARMLGHCREVALLDLFPLAVEKLRQPLEEAAGRGCHVAVKTYCPTRLAGVMAVNEPDAGEVVLRWGGQWANGVIDGQEYLLALLSADGELVHQSVWSDSPCFGWVYHCSLLGEIRLASLLAADGPGTLRRRKAYRRFDTVKKLQPMGLRRLLARSGLDSGGRLSSVDESRAV